MSAVASNWAWQIEGLALAAKLLLMKLADIADNEGYIRFISADYLARQTGISRSGVYDHMRRLEDAGVFAREKAGHRRDGAGLVTGRLILAASATPTKVQDRSSPADDPAKSGQENDEIAASKGEGGSPNPGLPSAPIREGGSPGFGLGGVQGLDSLYINNTYLNNTESSSTTTQGEAAREARQEVRAGERDFRSEFLPAYPLNSTMDDKAAEAVFRRLTLREQDAAIRGAAIYAADLKKRSRSQAVEAHRWLSEKRFEIAVATSREKSTPLPVFVWVGGDAYPLWDRWFRARHNGRSAPREPYRGDDPKLRGKIGWWFPTLYPPREEKPPDSEEAATF